MFGLLLLGSMGLAGCADSNYDLGNLNKTIAIGSEEGFALPGNNSTSDMILDDLLDLEDNDAIQVAEDGSYVFSRGADEEDVDGASPVVDEIPLTQVASENDFDYNLGEMLGEEARGPRKVSEDSPTAREIFSFEFQKSDLSAIEDVLGIALATLRAGINVDLNFSDDLKAQIGNLRGLTLDLPDFFDLEVDPNGNNITFNNQTNELKVDNLKEQGVHFTIRLKGLNFPEYNTEKVYDHGYTLYYAPDSVAVKAGIWLDADYDVAAARANAKNLDQKLIIQCHSEIDETIMLTGATGKFAPEIKLGEEGKPVGEFQINNLPDFLDDEDVHLSIHNPELRVWVNSNMDIRGVITEATIVATDAKGVEHQVEIETSGNALMVDPHIYTDADGNPVGSTKTAIIITDEPYTGKRDAHTYYGTPKNGQKLGNLLYNVPKKVSFDCTVAADSTYEGTIRLGYKDVATMEPWYTIQPSYEVYAPLDFTSDAVIVYRDSITGWHKDLEDVTLSNGAEVILTATVVNSLPLDLAFHAKAIELVGEEQWNNLSENLVDVIVTDIDGNDLRIAANGTTQIKIRLVQKNQEGFKRIDGIAFSASAFGNDGGETLNSRTQTLKVDNIGVSLRGKVIIDLED